MTTKTTKTHKSAAKTKPPAKRTNRDKVGEATRRIDARTELLVRVAGAVAAALVQSPSPGIAAPSALASAAVYIADEILKAAGVPSAPGADSAAGLGVDRQDQGSDGG